MAQTGKLKLELLDVFGKRVQERVDISLRNLQLTHSPVLKSRDSSKIISVTNLHGGPQGIYQISIDPPSYHPISQFINVKTSGDTELVISIPVDISKIVSVTFPTFPNLPKELRSLLTNSPNVLGFENNSGDALYKALDDIRRGGVLNIARKTQATRLTNGKSVLSLIKEIRELRGDRFFAFVEKELREEVKNSVNTGLFHPVDGSCAPACPVRRIHVGGQLQTTTTSKSD